MVIGITHPPSTEGAWSALSSNLSKSDLDNYVVKRSKRPLLEEVSWSRLPCLISKQTYLLTLSIRYYIVLALVSVKFEFCVIFSSIFCLKRNQKKHYLLCKAPLFIDLFCLMLPFQKKDVLGPDYALKKDGVIWGHKIDNR